MPSKQLDLLTQIDERTRATAADMAEIKEAITCLRTDVTALQLAQAEQRGATNMLWKLVSVIGITGIAALIKAFSQ